MATSHMETHHHPVCWPPFWRVFTRQFYFLVLGGIGAVTLVHVINSGGDAGKIFAHVSLSEFLLGILGITAALPVFTLLVAQLLRLYSVSVKDGILHGTGFSGRTKRIPLQDITGFGTLYNNGINTLVVKSRHHGSIHISEYTARLDDLFLQLCAHLPETEKDTLWQHLPFVLHSLSLTRGPLPHGVSEPVCDILKNL